MDLLGGIPSVVAFVPIFFPLSTFLLFRIHPGLIEIFLFPQVSSMKSARWSVKRSPQESTNPPIHPIHRDGFASSKREARIFAQSTVSNHSIASPFSTLASLLSPSTLRSSSAVERAAVCSTYMLATTNVLLPNLRATTPPSKPPSAPFDLSPSLWDGPTQFLSFTTMSPLSSKTKSLTTQFPISTMSQSKVRSHATCSPTVHMRRSPRILASAALFGSISGGWMGLCSIRSIVEAPFLVRSYS